MVGLILQILLARSLGATEFGVYAFSMSVLGIVSVFSRMGFETSAVRFTAAHMISESKEDVRNFTSFSESVVLLLSILSALMMQWIAAEFVESNDLRNALYLTSYLVPLTALLKVRSAILQGKKRVLVAQIMSEIFPIGVVAIGVAASLELYGAIDLESVFYIYIAAHFSAMLITVLIDGGIRVKGYLMGLDMEKAGIWLRASAQLLLVAGFSMILFQVDTVMVGIMVGTTEAGMYSVASKIAGVMVFMLASVNMVLSPIASELHVSRAHQQLQTIFSKGINAAILFSSFIAIILFATGRPILSIFGPEFVDAYWVLVILVIGQLGNNMVGSTGALINMTGHQALAGKILSLSAVFNIFLNYVLIRLLGIYGAAIATALMNILTNFTFAYFVWKRLNLIALPTVFLGKRKTGNQHE